MLAELLSTKEEPPRIWYNPNYAVMPRLVESLRFGVLEVQEHLDTFFDRKDHITEVSAKKYPYTEKTIWVNFRMKIGLFFNSP